MDVTSTQFPQGPSGWLQSLLLPTALRPSTPTCPGPSTHWYWTQQMQRHRAAGPPAMAPLQPSHPAGRVHAGCRAPADLSPFCLLPHSPPTHLGRAGRQAPGGMRPCPRSGGNGRPALSGRAPTGRRMCLPAGHAPMGQAVACRGWQGRAGAVGCVYVVRAGAAWGAAQRAGLLLLIEGFEGCSSLRAPRRGLAPPRIRAAHTQ